MASNPSDPNPNPAPAGGLQAMLARLRGMMTVRKVEESAPEPTPAPVPVAEPLQVAPVAPPPVAVPVPVEPIPAVAVPVLAEPVAEAAVAVAEPLAPLPVVAEVAVAEPEPPVPEVSAPVAEVPPPVVVPAVAQNCPICQAPRRGDMAFCEDCGAYFPPPGAAVPTAAPVVEAAPGIAPAPVVGGRIKNRFELGTLLGERQGVTRFRGLDHGSGTPEPAQVIILRAQALSPAPEAAVAEVINDSNLTTEEEEILPTFDFPGEPSQPTIRIAPDRPIWPTLNWEQTLLTRNSGRGLPKVIDSFTDNGYDYLVEEIPVGRTLWDAWDDPESDNERRYGWLKQLAEALRSLHRENCLLEFIRPDQVTITADNQVVLNDLADLLPLPLPEHPPLRDTLYTAPELVLSPDKADARANLFSFGALLYSLFIGRELADHDFEKQRGVPKSFIARFPDIHPLFGRIISKTFCRDVGYRFPTDEAGREDATGFTELIRTLEVCQRSLDHVRLEIAAWTTTGIVRTGNEDAFALMHAIESRQDDLTESALVLLCDGMGGYEAGEVAAAMAIQAMRKNLLQQKMFLALAGDSPTNQAPFNLDECKALLRASLKFANQTVHQASRSGQGRRGMGCTAEAVYINGRHVVVGHVGDSRTYHLHQGQIVQLTRDQTLVNRLIELGQLKPEDAETHPRRSELQQAIGGRADVDPSMYHGNLQPGDWVIACSDGLSNHIKNIEFKEMLQSEATSAEMAARRLVNFANLRGATDNATVVVIRVT